MLTQENKNAPWLLFEAGGLFKGLERARVCPLLINLEQQDVKGPLARFQFTLRNKEDMGKLLKTINHADPEKALREDLLQKYFDRVWPDFEKKFQQIREAHTKEAKPPQRSSEDMIVEILKTTRELQRNSERRELGAWNFDPGAARWSEYLRSRILNPGESENVGLTLYSEILEKAKEVAAKEVAAKEAAAKEKEAKEKPPDKSG